MSIPRSGQLATDYTLARTIGRRRIRVSRKRRKPAEIAFLQSERPNAVAALLSLSRWYDVLLADSPLLMAEQILFEHVVYQMQGTPANGDLSTVRHRHGSPLDLFERGDLPAVLVEERIVR